MFESRKPLNTMASDGKLHIVVFPWLAFGHMIPFLELAKRIAKRGHKISFLSTPRNIERLPKLPLNLAPAIALVKLPLPAVDGLPENAEATSDVPSEKVHFLKKAFDGLEPGLTQFLQTSNPDWIIYDFAPYWLPPIAAKLGISRGFFNAVNAWFLAFLGPSTNMIDGSDPRTKLEDYMVPPKWVPSNSNLAHRYYEIKWIVEGAQNITADVLDTYRLGSAIIGCEVLATRDCEEFEPDWLKILQELNKRTVLPVGLMPPSVQDSLDTNDPWVSIKGWLDGQTKGSVVYVGLGSELALSQETLTELALGLELSELPFLWALRNLPGSTESDPVQLPDGFEDRIKGRGVVWTSWVPQLRILAHDSVGGFLTHCGWSSIIEGLQFGHPLIMLPFMVEQGLNARIFEKNQVGVEIPRDDRNGSLGRNSVADSIQLVMIQDKGQTYRNKARDMRVLFGDKIRHEQYIDNFVEHLQNHRQIHKR
ncbi:putative UDP-rhamnose:rhamnosyltransferase 1 [Rhododendron vialii]|uniref:putative UDP-rhamnose:rhamnosyltransferase 1 n=1 Tax=Rhododendron vialii TaxID=182163 RepID=UPI00265E1821|nr:putative UDP-rhamnose:rhamnosyltransferase 1 [Rhododendron vialii]